MSNTVASLKLGASLDGGQQVVQDLQNIGNESEKTTGKVEKGAEKSTRAYNNLSTTLRKIRVDAIANGDAVQKALLNAQVRNPDLDITKYQSEINWTKQAISYQEQLNARMKAEQEEVKRTAQEYASLQKQIDQAIAKAESGMPSTSAGYLSNLAQQRGVQLSADDRSNLQYLGAMQSRQAQERAIQQQLMSEAKQLQSQEEGFISKIQRLQTSFATAGMTASDRMSYMIKQAGLDPSKFEPYIAELKKAEKEYDNLKLKSGDATNQLMKNGMTAKQYAAALRGVPAQFTDIVVSLQSGQAPLTVLLQQGGQLKDMFGGVGGAFKALGGYVLGLINPLTVMGATLAAVGVAAYQGASEQREFENALIATNSACGMTSSQLMSLAQDVGSTTGKYGEAAEAAAAFAASAKFDSASIEAGMKGISDMAMVTGKSVTELVGQFESLADKPSEAVLNLNEKYNFLTADIYKQVIALEKQGRNQDAVRLILEQMSSTSASRSQQMVAHAGYIMRAWWAVKDAILGAWNALKNFGRDMGRMDNEQILKNFQMSGIDPATTEAGRRAMQNLAIYKAMDKASQNHAKNLRNENAEIKKLHAGYRNWQKDQNKKPKKQGGGGAKTSPEQSSYKSLSQSITEKTDAVKQELLYGEKLTETDKLIIKINAEQANGKKKLTDAHKAELLERANALKQLEKELEVKKFMQKFDENFRKEKEKLVNKYADETAVLGMGTEEAKAYKEAVEIARKGEEQYQEALKKGATAEQLQHIKDVTQELIDTNERLREQYQRGFNDPYTALTESIKKYSEEAKNTGKQLRDAFDNAFKNMEDAFVKFVTTGKLSFKDLVNSILEDIARMYAKQAVNGFLEGIMQIGGNAIASWLGGGTTTTTTSTTSAYPTNSDVRVGYRAAGGPVNSGSPYIIGEKGPELFIPSSSGTVVPNNQLGQVVAGGFNIQISHRNEGTQQQVTSSGADFDGKNLIIKIVTQDIANDGMISRTMSKTFGMRRAAGAM